MQQYRFTTYSWGPFSLFYFAWKSLGINFSFYFLYATLVKIFSFLIQNSMKITDRTGVKCKKRKSIKASGKPPGRVEKEEQCWFWICVEVTGTEGQNLLIVYMCIFNEFIELLWENTCFMWYHPCHKKK